MVKPAGLRNRIVGSGDEAPDQLVANPLNWRIHPQAQQRALRGSLESVGWVQQVMVNKRTGNLVDGHARVEEALSRGEASIPVLYVDLEPEEEALVLATLDPIAAMAGQDDQKLRELLADLTIEDAGLAAMLEDLAPSDPKVGLTDPDDVPELGEPSDIQHGDVFTLGAHRLMCGDSKEPGDVARLMGGTPAAMVMADPPYGVKYTGGSGNDVPRSDSFSDDMDERTYGDWLTDILTNAGAVSDDQAALHIWFGTPMMRAVLDAIDGSGWECRALIFWNKLKAHYGALGAQYKLRYEPMWYAHRRGQSPRWYGPTNEPTVWDEDQPRVNELHPTMKPVALYERSLRNHTRTRDVVLELFSGSGTTLIAAETLRRRCFAMEIDPRYVAVAIERWENFTGEKAVKV